MSHKMHENLRGEHFLRETCLLRPYLHVFAPTQKGNFAQKYGFLKKDPYSLRPVLKSLWLFS